MRENSETFAVTRREATRQCRTGDQKIVRSNGLARSFEDISDLSTRSRVVVFKSEQDDRTRQKSFKPHGVKF